MSGSINQLFGLLPWQTAASQPNALGAPTQSVAGSMFADPTQQPQQAGGGSWTGPGGQQWPLTAFQGQPDNSASWLGPMAASWLEAQGAPATSVISAAAGTPAGAGIANPYQSILDAGAQQPQGQQMSPQMQQLLAMMAAGVPAQRQPGGGGTG